jgi:predicted nucleotidyltransferase
MVLNRDFREFIQLLNEHNVQYLVVGGYAVAFHGYPRYTKDIDIWVYLDRENAEKLLKVLADFGFGSLNLKIEDFLDPEQVIQLGYPPNRIDLLTDLKGVDFKNCYSSKVEVEIEGTQVNFINLEHLKKNKHATGRHQDLADLENLNE